MRDAKRLAAIRKLPCVVCGKPAPSEACHANWSEYGKSMGKKASDEFTISLCRDCHSWLDGYFQLTREESKEWFDKMLEKTERMLVMEDKEVF